MISRTLSGKSVDAQLHIVPDDAELNGDGIDATRIILKVTDEFGNLRPFATGAIQMTIEGAGEIIGENPFALVGGVGAVWVKTIETRNQSVIRLNAKHPFLGTKEAEIKVSPTAPEDI